MMNILVLCTGNSARSILLECLLNRHGAGRIRAFSAGSHPAGQVHPLSLLLLAAEGYDTGALRSKSWDEFAAPGAPALDLVITVCAAAAGEACPYWPGAPIRTHWGAEDPAALPPAAQPEAFRATYALLARRAAAFAALPAGSLAPAALKTALDRIGTLP
jgi:protein-tyrosine-phosphatase